MALAELETHEVEALVPYLHGDCYRDERLMLTATVDNREVLALNEVVVARGLSAGPLRVVVTMGERLRGRSSSGEPPATSDRHGVRHAEGAHPSCHARPPAAHQGRSWLSRVLAC